MPLQITTVTEWHAKQIQECGKMLKQRVNSEINQKTQPAVNCIQNLQKGCNVSIKNVKIIAKQTIQAIKKKRNRRISYIEEINERKIKNH